MKKILLVSGCSYADKNFKSTFYPNLDTSWDKWPEILAKKLNMDCVNLGYCGSGNDYVYSSLIDYIVQNNNNLELVISGWTKAARRSYTKVDYFGNEVNFNLRLDTHGDMDYFIKRSLRYYYSFQQVCKSLNIPFKQVHILNPTRAAIWDEKRKNGYEYTTKKEALAIEAQAIKMFISNSYFDKIDEKHFIGWPVEPKLGGFSMEDKLDKDKHFISEQDTHPNAEGHKLIAETIYENLNL